jgi:hypothetical protein
MADDITLPGAGEPVKTFEDAGGKHYQGMVVGYRDGGVPVPLNEKPATDAKVDDLIASVATEATLEAVRALVSTIRDAIRAEDATHTTGDTGIMALAVRRDTNATLATPDGDYAPLQVNEEGRLKVAALPGLYDLVTGAITANAQTVFCDVARCSNIMLHMVAASLVGHNVTFEGSIDSTNGTDGAWFAIQAVRSNANTIELTSGVLAATPAYAWELSVNGIAFVRVRATAHTSGTATWKFQRAPYATEPIPASQASATQPVSGSVTANVGTSGLTAFTDSSTNLGSGATFTGTSRDAGATPAFNRFVANAVADQAGTVRIEKSTDNTTWRRASKDIAVAANAPEQIEVRVTARYHRVVFVNGGVAQTQFLLTSAYQRI